MIEEDLKEFILSRYKSIRAFSQEINMPYSTLDSMFKRGLGNASITNVIRICDVLGISVDELSEGRISIKQEPKGISVKETDLLHKYRSVDDRGRQTIETVADMEYNRIHKPYLVPVAAHNDDESDEQLELMRQDIEDLKKR